METRRTRKPTLFDLMIFTAAVAAVIGIYNIKAGFFPIVEWPLWTLLGQNLRGRWDSSTYFNWLVFFGGLIHSTWPILYVATLAFPAIRFYGPRPRRRRLACQPGAVACFTAIGMMTAVSLTIWVLKPLVYLETPSFRPAITIHNWPGIHMGLTWLGQWIGKAILIAWLLLIVGGRWRMRTGWVDQIGIATGFAWIAWSVSQSITNVL